MDWSRCGILLVVLLAGCLGQPPSGPAESATTTQSPEPKFTAPETVVEGTTTDGRRSSPDTPRETPIQDDHEYALNQPDPDKAVILINEWNETVTIEVHVVHNATNETVYRATHAVEPGTDREVYNLRAANPDGVQRYRVTLRARDRTETITIETNLCYGDARGEIQDDSSLYLYHPIC